MLSLFFPNSFQVDVICGEETTVTFLRSNILPEDRYPFYGYVRPEAHNRQETKSSFRQLKQWPDFYSSDCPEENRSSGHSAGLKNYPLTSKSIAISQLYLCFTPYCSAFLGSREEPLHKRRQRAALCTDLWPPALENAVLVAWSILLTDCLQHLSHLTLLDLTHPAANPSLILLLHVR